MFPTGNTPLGLALNEVITPFSSFSLLNFAEQRRKKKKKRGCNVFARSKDEAELERVINGDERSWSLPTITIH